MRFEGIRQSLSSAGAWISACAQTAKTAVNNQCQRLRASVSRGFDSVSNFFAGIRDRVSSLFGRVSTTPTKEAARTEEAANPILQGGAADGQVTKH